MRIALHDTAVCRILNDVAAGGIHTGKTMITQVAVLKYTVGELTARDKVYLCREHLEATVLENTIVVE